MEVGEHPSLVGLVSLTWVLAALALVGYGSKLPASVWPLGGASLASPASVASSRALNDQIGSGFVQYDHSLVMTIGSTLANPPR